MAISQAHLDAVERAIKIQEAFELTSINPGAAPSPDDLEVRNKFIHENQAYQKLKTAVEMRAQLELDRQAFQLAQAKVATAIQAGPVADGSTKAAVKADAADENFIIQAYKKKFKNEKGEYLEGHAKPSKRADGLTELAFKNKKEAGDFFKEMAEQKLGFTVEDREGRLLAYSNGDGTLYGPDRNVLISEKFGEIDTNNPVMAKGFDIGQKTSSGLNPAQPKGAGDPTRNMKQALGNTKSSSVDSAADLEKDSEHSTIPSPLSTTPKPPGSI